MSFFTLDISFYLQDNKHYKPTAIELLTQSKISNVSPELLIINMHWT